MGKKLKVKISKIGIKDMLKFKNLTKGRIKAIAKAPADEVSAVFTINENAKKLHPDVQTLEIVAIKDHAAAGAKTYTLKRHDNFRTATFRAGQYLSVLTEIDGSMVTRPYSISSAPALTKEGKYEITVKSNPGGFAADKILATWKVGDIVKASAPLGNFYYDEIRDPKNIIAVAGGSGITPFLSMAQAIADKTENFDLTIIYGSKSVDTILFKDELDAICEKCDKVKVVHVLSDDDAIGYEQGFITAEIINKYAPMNDYSVFICGPEKMYRFVEKEIEKLDLARKNVRREMLGVTKNISAEEGYPAGTEDKIFNLTVIQGAKETMIEARANEPLLTAIERAGITAPSACRSGECGWCRSRLVSGDVFTPAENEYRRYADKKFGFVHPCCTFPLSDVVLEVPGAYVKY